jgi:hypothetical protein
MVLSWLKGRSEPAAVEELIARKKYDRAIELLRVEFEAGRRDPRLRLQLADVLVMSGREKEAVPILLALGDEFGSTAARRHPVLKKVRRSTSRSDVGKLASLIRTERPALAARASPTTPPRARLAATMK